MSIKLPQFVKHHSPILIFLIALFIPLLVGIFVINDDFKLQYSLIFQIAGMLLLSIWAIIGGYTLTLKIVANTIGRITEKSPWKLLEKILFIIGTGFIVTGLMIELSLAL